MRKMVRFTFFGLLAVLLITSACKKHLPPESQAPEAGKSRAEAQKPEGLSETEVAPEKTPEVSPAGEIGVEKIPAEGYVLDPIHFDFDKYDIREDVKPILLHHAAWLKEHPAINLIIEGHCDERGTIEYNLALGERRANATKQYLVNLGLAASRMSCVSYGKEKPADPSHNEEAWAKNRRAEFRRAR